MIIFISYVKRLLVINIHCIFLGADKLWWTYPRQLTQLLKLKSDISHSGVCSSDELQQRSIIRSHDSVIRVSSLNYPSSCSICASHHSLLTNKCPGRYTTQCAMLHMHAANINLIATAKIQSAQQRLLSSTMRKQRAVGRKIYQQGLIRSQAKTSTCCCSLLPAQ
jgi:hypothetical protein